MPTAVCAELGLDVSTCVTGEMLRNMNVDESDPEYRGKLADLRPRSSSNLLCTALVLKATLFARLNPNQKASVVHVLKEAGNVVGFLGDGANSLALAHTIRLA